MQGIHIGAENLLVDIACTLPIGVHGTSACDCCCICWRNVVSEHRLVLRTLQRRGCSSVMLSLVNDNAICV